MNSTYLSTTKARNLESLVQKSLYMPLDPRCGSRVGLGLLLGSYGITDFLRLHLLNLWLLLLSNAWNSNGVFSWIEV